MSSSYVLSVGNSFSADPTEPIMTSIFRQYERVLIESLISSFGLDFIIKDQYGGDVDTIHNVRQLKNDDRLTYKNVLNQKNYENRGSYNSHEYHSDSRYIDKNRMLSAQKASGKLVDAYTGKRIAPNGKTDLDHVISAKEIHDDPGRVLAGLRGTDLANSEDNLQVTNPHTNRTKKASSMDQFLNKYGNEYSEEQQANMRSKDSAARVSYETKLATAYYTSPGFAKDVAVAAKNVGARMGARQALGFVFAEMWFSVKAEFQKIESSGKFHLGDFLEALGRGLKRGFENAKSNYKELFAKFLNGAIAGTLSSVTTTLCNVFFATAKNTAKIIRQSYASLVEAAKVLFINPENYMFGERMRSVAKIIATGASVVVGVLVSEAVEKTPIGTIPVIGDVVQTFCGTFAAGIMSCTLLYFLDQSEVINRLVKTLDGLHMIEAEVNYYREQAAFFENYAAQLMQIDIKAFRQETALYRDVALKIVKTKTAEELNSVLYDVYKSINIRIPWDTHRSFNEFMGDKNARLIFE